MIKIAANIAIDICRDAKEAEACATRSEGINLGLDHNLVPGYIESHCVNAVQGIYKDTKKSCYTWL
jgi:hypothetical protein